MMGIDAEIKEIRRGKEKVRAICISGDGVAEVLRPIPRHSLADEIVCQDLSERETKPACAAPPSRVKVVCRSVVRALHGGGFIYRKPATDSARSGGVAWHWSREERCWKRHRKTKYK